MARSINVKIVGDSRSYERALKKASQSTEKFGKKMRKTLTGGGAKSILKAGGLGALFGGAGALGLGIGAGVSSVRAAADFEATMSRIQGLAGQSAKQVAQWSDDLIRLGPAIGKTPQELAEALYFIASSGVPATKALDVLRVSAKAAAAGLGETQVVADAVTSVMNAYATQGMSAAHATDVLVATVREGKGEADEFAGVIGNVAAFASKLNVPFEQVGAALAAMTQLGTDPRTAATQLQALFSQILKATDPMRKKAKELGLTTLFDELQQKITSGDLLGALRQLKGLSALDLANIFPNVRAVRAALALVETGGGRVEGIFRRMGVSTGSAKNAFAAYANTSKHHMEQLGASVEALKIAFGQGLAPVVGKVAEWLAHRFADPKFVARVRQLGIAIGVGLTAAFRAVSTWFTAHWPQITRGFASLKKLVIAVIPIVRTLKTVMVAITKPLQIQMKILLAIWDKVLAAIQTGANLLSKIPTVKIFGHKIGGDNFSGLRDAAAAARGALNGISGKDTGSGPRRGRGGGGPHHPGSGDVHVYIDGQKVAQVTQRRLQRKGKSNAGSRRGRHGGESLGIG